LDKALPKDIVFTCLNPNQGWSPQLPVLAEIAPNRETWAIPWLEGDRSLWHFQPRVGLLREQVLLAKEKQLRGVLAIHWRTEETRANLDAFARFAANPAQAPTVEAFYQEDCEARLGKAAATVMVPLLMRLDKEQALSVNSPEYFSYDPSWGRLTPELRKRLEGYVKEITGLMAKTPNQTHQGNLDWLQADFEFTLLLDEVSRALEPAYRLKERFLTGRLGDNIPADEAATARQALNQAPMEKLFRAYARRVRSKGELGVLSSLNQRLWRQYRELAEFLPAPK
jgi:hypothetical protein